MVSSRFCWWALLSLWLLPLASPAQRLAAGNAHTASIHPDGTLWTWGHNSNGQLGDGTSTNQTSPQ